MRIASPKRVIVLAAACGLALCGCSMFHRTSPQQEYFNALKMGNAAQASQLWLQMSPEQRARFERGEDIRPSISHNAVQQAIDQHYSDQGEDGATSNQVQVNPDLGGGLQDLPSYLNSQNIGGTPQIAPSGQ